MKNNKMISEAVDAKCEVITVTSAAGSTSRQYDMRGYDQALLSASISGNFTTVTIDLMESSAATVAGTSAAGSKAGMILGGASTLISTAGGVQKMTLTMGTASTDAEYFTLKTGTVSKKFINTTSTALLNSSAWVSSALYFGSTVGSTVNTGLQLSIDALITAIESTLAFGTDALVLSTGTTASLTIQAGPAAVGNLGLSASAVMTAVVNEVAGGFNIKADQLASTANKRYVSLKISTAATSCPSAVSVIRSCGHHMPPVFSGKLST